MIAYLAESLEEWRNVIKISNGVVWEDSSNMSFRVLQYLMIIYSPNGVPHFILSYPIHSLWGVWVYSRPLDQGLSFLAFSSFSLTLESVTVVTSITQASYDSHAYNILDAINMQLLWDKQIKNIIHNLRMIQKQTGDW